MIRSLTNNLGMKIICLILAFFLWYVLKNEETVTKTLKVSIKTKINEKMYLMKVDPGYVKVTLQGSRKDMKNIENASHVVVLNLTDVYQPQIIQNQLQETDFPYDPQLKIIKIEPKKVEIEIDRLEEKFVEVEAVTEGSVAPNYDLTQIKLVPSRIKINGPEKILKQIDRIKTEKINIDSMNTNFIQEVPLVPIYQGFEANQSIKALINISKSKQEKTFDKIPIRIMQPPNMNAKYSITPAEVQLTVSASTLDFQGINRDDFTAFVDVTGLANGTYELPISIVQKDSFKILKVDPKSVEVKINDRS